MGTSDSGDFDTFVRDWEERDPDFRAARQHVRRQYAFADALILARVRAGLTQEELAHRLGTTQSAIARLERGDHLPTVETLYKLAQALGIRFRITPDEMLAVEPYRPADVA